MHQVPTIEKGKRRERGSFERTLKKILAKCVAGHVYEVEWTDPLVPWIGRQSSKFELANLWVVGSFARGAIECGDLDLVLEIKIVSGRQTPPVRSIPRATFGQFPRVSLFIGTPQQNSAHVNFNDAVLLWNGEINWLAALENIKIDPEAGRFQRDDDLIPFRSDQLSSFVDVTEAIEGIRQGMYSSQFVPMEDMGHLQAPTDCKQFMFNMYGSQKTREMLGLALAYLHKSEGLNLRGEIYRGDNITEVVGEGWSINTGPRPRIPLWRLKWPEISNLAIIPHRTKRGPNGLWLIKRGKNHPSEENQ